MISGTSKKDAQGRLTFRRNRRTGRGRLNQLKEQDMTVPAGTKKTALTGNGLVDALNKSTDQIRGDAGIRLKADIAVNTEGEAAYRYYGKTLPQAVSGAGELLRAGLPAGVFPGLGFTYNDYVQAQTRADDTAKAEAKIRALSTDASAEAKDARDKLAGMTFQIQRGMEYVQASPAADPAHKAIITANGAHFNDALTDRRNMIAESRHVNAEHRATVAA